MSREDNPPWLFTAIVTKFKFLNLALSDEALQGFRPCLLTQPLLLPPAPSSGLKPHDLFFSNRVRPLGLARTISATPPTSFESLHHFSGRLSVGDAVLHHTASLSGPKYSFPNYLEQEHQLFSGYAPPWGSPWTVTGQCEAKRPSSLA